MVDQHRADIAARHRERAVGEVDEIHQPERDREPAGQHEQQHAVGDAVEQVGETARSWGGEPSYSGVKTDVHIYDVMAGLVPAIHVFSLPRKTVEMPGASPGMTSEQARPGMTRFGVTSSSCRRP